ncbi:MAG: glycosyltransferase [Rhodobacterales bacterium]|nr:glycosyltransferase [Rhodobacterales bacterium]
MAERDAGQNAVAKPLAVVVSPFATHPADAGQRRRAYQTTAMLRDRGYRVIFVFHAFEENWRWIWDDQAMDRMAAEWDEFHIYPGSDRIGQPPRNGHAHQLEEWWDDGFGEWLLAISQKRHIDLVVVHNVWLSKALTLFPPVTVKVLDSHDIFHLRRDVDAVAAAEFFNPTAATEWYGLSRADVVLAIQGSEAKRMADKVSAAVRFLPYAAPEQPGDPQPAAVDYQLPDRVRFGFIGNGSLFNRRALDEIVTALRLALALDPAPVELVVAGSVSEALKPGEVAGLVLGRVEHESEFYDACDIVLSPIFVGTGMKVKSVDALARGKPTLFSRHAAEGLPIPADLIFDTPAQMVRRMCLLAHERPPLGSLQRRIRAAHAVHVMLTRRRENAVFDAIDARRPLVEVHLDGPGGDEARFLNTCVALAHARWLRGHIQVELVTADPALAAVAHLLPPGVTVCDRPRAQDPRRPLYRMQPDADRPGVLSGLVEGAMLRLDGPADPLTWEAVMRPWLTRALRTPAEAPLRAIGTDADGLAAARRSGRARLIALGADLPARMTLPELVGQAVAGRVQAAWLADDLPPVGPELAAVQMLALFGTRIETALLGPIPPERHQQRHRECSEAIYRWTLARPHAQ